MKIHLYPSVKNLRSLFQRELILLAVIYIIWIYFLPDGIDVAFVVFMSIAIAIEWLPAIYFAIYFYKYNKGQIFEIDSQSLTVIQNEDAKKYNRDDIEKVIIFMSGNNPRFNFVFHSIELFHFAQIVMKNGEYVIITSICSAQVDETLEEYWDGIPFEYKWGLPRLGKVTKAVLQE